MRLVLIGLVSLVMVACDSSKPAEEAVTRQVGNETSENWRMVIQLPGQELPVQMHLASDNSEAWFGNIPNSGHLGRSC